MPLTMGRREFLLSPAALIPLTAKPAPKNWVWIPTNTRRTPDEAGPSRLETENSLYNFGIPDFSAYSIASQKDQTKLIKALQAAIKTFEPRMANVRILPLEVTTTGLRALRIRIEGLLLMDPAPEHISFDTTLQLTTGDFRIKDSTDG